jgi:hypothetical protein
VRGVRKIRKWENQGGTPREKIRGTPREGIRKVHQGRVLTSLSTWLYLSVFQKLNHLLIFAGQFSNLLWSTSMWSKLDFD